MWVFKVCYGQLRTKHSIKPSEYRFYNAPRDVRPHLKGFNVIDASLKREIQLLWARAGTDSNYLYIYFIVNIFAP